MTPRGSRPSRAVEPSRVAPERPLDEAWFARPPLLVARALLGALLVRRVPSAAGLVEVARLRLTEVEAYGGDLDDSCFRLRGTGRGQRALQGPPGRYYLHPARGWPLLNVTCAPDGTEGAVLLRVARVVSGEAWLAQHRPARSPAALTDGPGKLVQALCIEHLDGQPVTHPELSLLAGPPIADADVVCAPRVGLSRGADLPWRFLDRRASR